MSAAEQGARPPYCQACGYKHIWSERDLRWYVQQLRRLYGPGRSYASYEAYRCPSGNGWHLHSRDDDMRVAAGYAVPPSPRRR